MDSDQGHQGSHLVGVTAAKPRKAKRHRCLKRLRPVPLPQDPAPITFQRLNKLLIAQIETLKDLVRELATLILKRERVAHVKCATTHNE